MNRGKQILVITLTLLLAANAHAASLGVIITPPGFLNVLVLAGAIVGFWGAYKVRELVKGGLLGTCWQYITIALLLLAAAQFIQLLHSVQLVAVPSFLVPLLMVAMAGTLGYGIYLARRNLE